MTLTPPEESAEHLAMLEAEEERISQAEKAAKIENLALRASILTSPNDLFLNLLKQVK